MINGKKWEKKNFHPSEMGFILVLKQLFIDHSSIDLYVGVYSWENVLGLLQKPWL